MRNPANTNDVQQKTWQVVMIMIFLYHMKSFSFLLCVLFCRHKPENLLQSWRWCDSTTGVAYTESNKGLTAVNTEWRTGDVTQRRKLISACLPPRNNPRTIFITPLVAITSSPTFPALPSSPPSLPHDVRRLPGRCGVDDDAGIGNRRPCGTRDVCPERE